MTEDIRLLIDEIEMHPFNVERIHNQINSKELLDKPIRDGAWTPRQIFHHLADSHINSYIRIKLALTEDNPTIKPYNEKLWAELPDVGKVPVEFSLKILEGIHKRSANLLRQLLNDSKEDLDKKLVHPEIGELTVKEYLKVFAEHGISHLNAISKLIETH